MIEISKIKEKEWELLEQTAKKHQSEINKRVITEDCLIMREDNKILGFGYYEVINKSAWIKELKIFIPDKAEYDTYHDFLLRSLMNAAESKGLEHIRISKNCINNRIKMMDIEEKGQDIFLNIKDYITIPCGCEK